MVLIADRLAALADAVAAGRDALPAELVDSAHALAHRAGERLAVSEVHTVVAVAGATGSGKSSLVNALVGEQVATVDVLRPTTEHALAVVHGVADAGPLLDWLGVAERVALAREPHGLVLLDLPDHDSVRTAHRLEAERLIGLVDLMVWVLDPQKYADAAVHERYLRSLASHRDVLMVVLNQVDRFAPAETEAALADVRRLLAEDGLAGVRLLAVSARTGAGVEALHAALAEAAARHEAHRARIEADAVVIAGQVLAACGGARPAAVAADRELVAAFAEAAGVPTVLDAVAGGHRRAAHLATGWPPTRWLGRLRADPLAALHLGTGRQPGGARGAGREPTEDVVRTSLPPAGPAQLARAAGAVRDWRDRATGGLPDAWVLAARAHDPGPDLADELDRAVARTQVLAGRRPRWWALAGAAQWLWLAAAVGGLGWLGGLAGLAGLRLDAPTPPQWGPVPAPTALVIGGVLLGLVTALVARVLAGVGARRRVARARTALHRAIADVAERLVVAPVADVVARLERCRSAAGRAAAHR